MKIKPIVSALMAVSLLLGGNVFAQGNGHGNGKGNDNGRNNRNSNRDNQCQDRNGHCPPGQDRRDNNARRTPQPGNYGRPDVNNRRDERGAGPNHAYYKGGRLPLQYRTHQYVVDDWRGHHLSAPPRGYHWVQSGGDYLLVAIATGIILQLLLSN